MTVGGDAQLPLPPEAENELVAELARLALEQAAPEELVLFQETAEDYFRDPQAVLDPGGRDEPLGFGLELAMLTPYVLAVATPVIRFLASTVADAAGEEVKPLVARIVRRLFRRPDPASEATQAGAAAAQHRPGATGPRDRLPARQGPRPGRGPGRAPRRLRGRWPRRGMSHDDPGGRPRRARTA
jgi:hypothetical protein